MPCQRPVLLFACIAALVRLSIRAGLCDYAANLNHLTTANTPLVLSIVHDEPSS